VKSSPLKKIIKDYPELFDSEESFDADYNVKKKLNFRKFY